MIGQRQTKTNPITIKPKSVKHVESSSPGFLCPAALPPAPLPDKFSWFIISMCVSLYDSFLRVRLESSRALNGVLLAAAPKRDSAEAVTVLSHLLFSVYLLNLLIYL